MEVRLKFSNDANSRLNIVFSPSDILLDVAGAFGHLFHSLPKQHGVYGSGAFFARTADRNAETTQAMAQLKINELYTAEILNAVKEIRECRSLAQSRIVCSSYDRFTVVLPDTLFNCTDPLRR